MANNTNYLQVLDLSGVQQLWNTCKQTFIQTVNGNGPDTNGNVVVSGVSALDAYPVGSIYLSVDNTSPASLFGGSWTALNNGNKCYIAKGDTKLITSTDIYHMGTEFIKWGRQGVTFNNKRLLGMTEASDNNVFVAVDVSASAWSDWTAINMGNLYVNNTTYSEGLYMWKRVA